MNRKLMKYRFDVGVVWKIHEQFFKLSTHLPKFFFIPLSYESPSSPHSIHTLIITAYFYSFNKYS